MAILWAVARHEIIQVGPLERVCLEREVLVGAEVVNPQRLGPGWLCLLVGHLEKEQVGQLLDVIPVGESIVTQDVAVVPELLDDLLRMVGHKQLSSLVMCRGRVFRAPQRKKREDRFFLGSVAGGC